MKNAFLITGAAGSGKSTLTGRLQQLGYSAVDGDALPRNISGPVDLSGNATSIPERFTSEWLNNHRWLWDRKALTAYIQSQDLAKPFFLLGSSDNQAVCFDLFERVFYLELPESALLKRLKNPRLDNTFGQTPAEQVAILERLGQMRSELSAIDAHPLGAQQSPDDIIRELMDRIGHDRY